MCCGCRLLGVGGPFHELARTRPGILVRQHLGAPVERWRAQIPGTFDEYLSARSSKTRSNVKRYSRRLEERYGDGVSFRVFRTPDELEELLRDTEAVHVKTYQHGMGAGLKGTELEKRLRELAAERGWFRGFVRLPGRRAERVLARDCLSGGFLHRPDGLRSGASRSSSRHVRAREDGRNALRRGGLDGFRLG